MKKINEILAATILYCIISYILNLPSLEYGIILAITASQINIILPKNYKHTLIYYIALTILTLNYMNITIPIMVGYGATIFIALLSKQGCKLLYPIKDNTFTGPKNYLENNTNRDHAVTSFLIILTIITLIFSTSGEEILETLTEENITHYINTNHSLEKTEYDKNYVQYINIDAEDCNNLNITTTQTNNTTTTIIKNYSNK